MDLNEFSFARLSSAHNILPFDCGDSDLNNYLVADAKPHLDKLLFVTYVFEKDGKTAAFFSIANDVVSADEFVNRKRVFKDIVFKMREQDRWYKSYPAIKIGRFAIHTELQKQGLGIILLDFIKQTFVTNNRTGCMLVTVDAYIQSIAFYEKNNFKFICDSKEEKENKNTRLMCYDLRTLR